MGLIFVKPLAAALVLVAILGFLRKQRGRASHLPLPPGPPGELLIGHLRVVPKENTAGAFAKWSEEYGAYNPPESQLFVLGPRLWGSLSGTKVVSSLTLLCERRLRCHPRQDAWEVSGCPQQPSGSP